MASTNNMNKYTTTTGAGTSAAHNTLYKVRSKQAGKFFGSLGKFPSLFNPEIAVEKWGFGVTERYASILTEDQVRNLHRNFEPSDLETIQLNGKGTVILKNKLTGKYYADGKSFNVDEDEATVITVPSPEYHTIRYSYDLTEVWHIVVPEIPSTNATWDKFLIDLNDLYPIDPEDSATDEELAHAGVRIR
jgi:hypothetical protein